MAIEYRTATAETSGSEGTLRGLVTPFGVETTIGDLKHGGFREKIAPEAFTKTLGERDVVLVHSHDTSKPLARTSIRSGPGSLTLTEDSTAGLRMEAVPVQTSYGKDVLTLAAAGVIKGMSFGFTVARDSWTDDEGRDSTPSQGTVRTIHEVILHEVTTTAFPAYPSTELAARDSINAARESRDDKYSADERDEMAKSGEALADGTYPIRDAQDLDSAISLAGTAKKDSEETVRKHIIARAKALGLSHRIPGTWNTDGTVTEQNSTVPAAESRNTDATSDDVERASDLALIDRLTIESMEWN